MRILFSVLFFALVSAASAQPVVVDKVIGVVGKYPILLSELQTHMLERESEPNITKCKIFEMLVYQKLLVAQADRDSLTVTDQEVETELNRRMAYFIQKFGSEEKLEKYYGKRTNVIKDDFRSDVKEQILAEKMSNRINGDNKLSPAEVRQYFNTIPVDSLPLIGSEVELQHLVKQPAYSPDAKSQARAQLSEIRQKIVSGKSTMRIQAVLNSKDTESAKKGGEMLGIMRGQTVPEFDAVAFRLKNGEISEVFETMFGFHIIELIQRKGEMVDLRHILIQPELTIADFNRSKNQLDTIYANIRNGKITFEEAVRLYSDDKDTKQNMGLLMNPRTASTKFDAEMISQMDDKLVGVLSVMQPGEISKPMEFYGADGKRGFRIVKLKSRIDPHRANLKDDYQRMAALAANLKGDQMKKEWIKNKSKTVYIRLDPEIGCKFENDWTFTN